MSWGSTTIHPSSHVQPPEIEREFKRTIASLRLIFFVLLSAQLLFAAAVLFMSHKFSGSVEIGYTWITDILLPLIILAETVIASRLASNRMTNLHRESHILTRLQLYKSTCLLKWAMLEGATLLSLIGLLLTNTLLYLGMSILLLAIFLINRPSAEHLRAMMSDRTADEEATA